MCYSFIPNGAEVKYSLFHGRDRTSTLPNRAPKKFVTFWEEEERRQPQRAKRVLCCKAVLTSQRLCLTYSTRWVLRMIWLCSIILGEFVSKYTVFSHKGGVRTLADNPRAHAFACYFMVICASVFAENWGWRSATERTPSIAPEESPLWGLSAIHRTKYCPLTPFAWLSMFRLPRQLTAHPYCASGATSALADAFYVHYSRMLFGYSCEKHPFF